MNPLTDKRPFARTARVAAALALAGAGASLIAAKQISGFALTGTAISAVLAFAAPAILGFSFAVGRISTRIEELSQNAESMKLQLDIAQRQLDETRKAASKQSSALLDKIAKSDATLSASGEAVNRLKARMESVEKIQRSIHVHSRTLSSDDEVTLLSDWAKPLGLQETERSIRYMSYRIQNIERLCAGRLATDIQTIIARCLTAAACQKEKIEIVEIGTLFGIGAIALHDICASLGKRAKLTLIDPLDGYYGEDIRDYITHIAVSRRTLESNLRRAGVPQEDVTIVQRLSGDAEARAALAATNIDLLIIDGDHSYDGVKLDFHTYTDLIAPGGFVLFDDYETETWPDIKKYVDEEPALLRHYQAIASGFRTAAFQKR